MAFHEIPFYTFRSFLTFGLTRFLSPILQITLHRFFVLQDLGRNFVWSYVGSDDGYLKQRVFEMVESQGQAGAFVAKSFHRLLLHSI